MPSFTVLMASRITWQNHVMEVLQKLEVLPVRNPIVRHRLEIVQEDFQEVAPGCASIASKIPFSCTFSASKADCLSKCCCISC